MVVVVVAATARAVVLLGRWVWLLGCLVARLFLWVFGLLGSLNKNEQRETAPPQCKQNIPGGISPIALLSTR